MPSGGKREGAGRKPLLANSSVRELLQVSYDTLIRWLNNPKVPQDKKAQVAAEFIKRRVPISQDTPMIDQSQHQHFTFTYGRTTRDQIQSARRTMAGMGKSGTVEGTGSGPEVREDDTRDTRTSESGTGDTKS